jgi:chemotaxis protein MotB
MARTRQSQEDEEGEGYFASVSDLMVGVLFVFLLMLTVFALNFRDAEQAQMVERSRYEEAVREQERARREAEAQARLAAEAQKYADEQAYIARQEQENARREAERARIQQDRADEKEAENLRLRDLLTQAMSQLERDIEDRTAARDRLLASVERELVARGVKVHVDQRSGVLRLSGDLLFGTGSAVLSAEARRTVQALSDVMSRTLPCYTSGSSANGCAEGEAVLETVLVEGHTDRQRFGTLDRLASQDQNDRLSAERSLSVFLEIRRSQPTIDALRNASQQPLLGVSGYGERRPLADSPCANKDDCAADRRIDLRFVLSARSSAELQRIREEIARVLDQKP